MVPFLWRCGAKREPGRAKHQEPGWFVQLPIIGGLNQPPRLRPLKRLRGIFLMVAATPPCPRRGLRLSLQLFSMPPCPAKDVGHGKPGGRAPESRSLSPWAPWERDAEGRVRVMASCLSPPDLSPFFCFSRSARAANHKKSSIARTRCVR